MTWKLVWLIAVLPACALLAACGDDDNADPDAGRPDAAAPRSNKDAAAGPADAGSGSLVRCAAEGRDCSRAGLNQRMLDGCCDGLVCKASSSDVRVCRSGSPEELALALECKQPSGDAMGGFTTELAIDQRLASNRGALPFDRVSQSSIEFGPGGCLSAADLTLAQSDHAMCALTLHAGPSVDADGALVLAQGIELDTRGCSGLAAGAKQHYGANVVSGTLAFDGLACEPAPFAGPWCAAGGFLLRLHGAIDAASAAQSSDEDAGGSEMLLFDGTPTGLVGRVCGMAKASACPAP